MKKIGKQTFIMANDVIIKDTYSVVGPKEGEGPLRDYFDLIITDSLWEEDSWEKCEQKLQKTAVEEILVNNNITKDDVDLLLAGDLLNQIVSSSYAARSSNLPFIGLYGACSTMSLSIGLGSMLIDGGFASNIICVTSSHFCSAERQYRAPLEMGGQRPLSSQWTVTGSGAVLLSNSGIGPKVKSVTFGSIEDLGITDADNMGAAMAPAATRTIKQHLEDIKGKAKYDLIVTGDLATVGRDLTNKLLKEEGIDISNKYEDCGMKIYDIKNQDVHSGGSGCGCSAVVFSSYYYKLLKEKRLKSMLLTATGALHSPTIFQQGESIPGIAHAVGIES